MAFTQSAQHLSPTSHSLLNLASVDHFHAETYYDQAMELQHILAVQNLFRLW